MNGANPVSDSCIDDLSQIAKRVAAPSEPTKILVGWVSAARALSVCARSTPARNPPVQCRNGGLRVDGGRSETHRFRAALTHPTDRHMLQIFLPNKATREFQC